MTSQLQLELDVENPDLTDDTEMQNKIFLQVFNSGDGELLDRLYREDSISNVSGQPLTGAPRLAFFKEFLASKPRLWTRVERVYVAGDVALIILVFRVDSIGPDGELSHLEGLCTDVLRRGDDGRWLMSIDRQMTGSLIA